MDNSGMSWLAGYWLAKGVTNRASRYVAINNIPESEADFLVAAFPQGHKKVERRDQDSFSVQWHSDDVSWLPHLAQALPEETWDYPKLQEFHLLMSGGLRIPPPAPSYSALDFLAGYWEGNAALGVVNGTGRVFMRLTDEYAPVLQWISRLMEGTIIPGPWGTEYDAYRVIRVDWAKYMIEVFDEHTLLLINALSYYMRRRTAEIDEILAMSFATVGEV